MKYNRAKMKLSAKEAMRTSKPKAIWGTLIFWLLTVMLASVVQFLVPNPVTNLLTAFLTYPELLEKSPELVLTLLGSVGSAAVISLFVSVVLGLYNIVMSYGYAGYALKIYRRENPGFGALFAGFPKAGTVIGSSIMVGIFSFLWCLLGVVAFAVVAVAASLLQDVLVAMVLIYIIAYIALILYLFWTLYRYAMVPYFVMDQNMPVFDAIRASKNAMRGNKFKMFVLEISFIGWYLLVGLISSAIMVIGIVVAVLLAGSGIEQLLYGIVDYFAFAGSGVALLVAGAVATLATLPLEIWLIAYQQASTAGFYQCLMDSNAQAVAPVTATGGESYPPTDSGYIPLAPTPVEPPVNPVEPPVTPVEPPVTPVMPDEALDNEPTIYLGDTPYGREDSISDHSDENTPEE